MAIKGLADGAQNDKKTPDVSPVFKSPADETSPDEVNTPELPESPVEDDADDTDYVYVRVNGKIRAIPRSEILDEAPATSKSDAVRQEEIPVPEVHFYVHLSNGDVERVKEEDLPGHAGSNAVHGFWQKDSKVYQIIGVYPVENDVVKGA